MKRVAAVVFAALSLSASAPQEKGAIIWAKSWSDALAEASVRNVPIVFTVHKDG
jgi:hypothetical protein